MKFFYSEMLDVEGIDRLTFVNNVMEVLTLSLICFNFRYIGCCVNCSVQTDHVSF